MTAATLDMLELGLDQAGALIEGIRPEQAGLPTPCTAFDVRALVNHIVYDLETFARLLTGQPRGSADADLLGADWSRSYRQAAAALLEIWREQGTDGTMRTGLGELPRTWALGQHLSDITVHAWDVARATGQSTELNPELAEVSLEWAHENLKPQFRGQAFGPEVPVPESAPIYDRLVGFFGRAPGA